MLGIISVVLSFVPVVLHLGFVLGVLALIFGIVALARRVRAGVTGTVLGGIGVVLSLVFGTVYGLTALQATSTADATDDAADSAQVEVPDVVGKTIEDGAAALTDAGFVPETSDTDSSAGIASQSPAAGERVAKGSTVRLTPAEADGSSANSPAPVGTKFQMTNTNRLDGTETDYTQWIDGYNDNFTPTNEYEQPDANMKYVVLTVHVTASTAGVDASSAAYDVALAATDGAVYESTYLSDLEEMPSVTLGAGQSATGKVVFEVPNTFHGGIASFGDGSVFVKTN
ncbi:PASTA domain-containing protein [Curtobacterium sp. MCPF17_051]|uniref:PASTA domain-containing protein n=1 Tax=Curtobacterium sp. MCPF17_051 TaxID=2175640 RepID=UPI0015E8821C|nr:PASTA domain-containing protein [Curtobacterium sp. MCPF17_051]